MGNNPARKMMRTKREQALLMENMNRDAVEQLMKQHVDLAQKFMSFVTDVATKWNGFLLETVKLQKEVLAMKNALKSRGLITEYDIAKEYRYIEEREELERNAIIIGEHKGDDKEKRDTTTAGVVEGSGEKEKEV